MTHIQIFDVRTSLLSGYFVILLNYNDFKDESRVLKEFYSGLIFFGFICHGFGGLLFKFNSVEDGFISMGLFLLLYISLCRKEII